MTAAKKKFSAAKPGDELFVALSQAELQYLDKCLTNEWATLNGGAAWRTRPLVERIQAKVSDALSCF